MRASIGESGKYECGTWASLPVWAALAVMAERPEIAKACRFWEWMPSNSEHIMIHTDNACWWLSRSTREVW